MERPSSATNAPSTTSGPTHKRNVSTKGATRPSGLSVVSLFVTNLRLLNLDLLPDWPNITVASFQDARAKIRCTEYALYQLFRLYDPATTADKLRPFFPPLEPLQSVNLRAALFRCLNELKKNGVLGRETVLRKTMLDECQGDRFWEVCLGFSAIALRKVALERRSKYGRPVAEKIGIAHSVTKVERESLLPLAIAHRAALSKVLDEKQRKKETYARLYDLLNEKEAELRQRRARSQENVQTARQDKLKAVEQAVDKNWIGSTQLKDGLINSDTCAQGDGVLVKPFDKLWSVDGDSIQSKSSSAEIGLLQSLTSKAAEQSARLRRWQDYHNRLVSAKPTAAQPNHTASASQRGPLRFDRHRRLNFSDVTQSNDRHPQQTHDSHVSASRYDEILTAMREELRKTSAHRSRSAKSPQAPPVSSLRRARTKPFAAPRLNVVTDASPGASNPHARSPSQTADPIRPGMARRASSRSRSYQQPKVVSQREPIQLKSELFSPLKGSRRSSLSPVSASTSMLPSPVEGVGSSSLDADDLKGADGEDNVQSGGVSNKARLDSGISLHGDAVKKDIEHRSARSSTSISEVLEREERTVTEFKVPELPVPKPPSTDRGVRPSLAQRTRMSVAFNSSEDITGFLPKPPTTVAPPMDGKDDRNEVSTPQPSFDRRATLLDRTRQSISMAPPLSKATTSPQSRARTSIYPVNQFDTPKKSRRSTVGLDEKRKITPVEQLFSPDAEYTSVFKSRPKIALSPISSPRANAGEDAGLEVNVGRSSPLVGVGVGD